MTNSNMPILPMEIINYICLFNSHPVADALRKDKVNREMDKLRSLLINKLKLPSYILSYNKPVFQRRMREISVATLSNTDSFMEKSDKISNIECLRFLYKTRT